MTKIRLESVRWMARNALPAGALALCAVGCSTKVANHVVLPAENRGLVVSGNGKINAAPDTAVVNIGVETREADPKAAVEHNSHEMTMMVANLKGMGIAESDLQTSNFNVRFERLEQPWPPPNPPSPVSVGSTKVAAAPVEAPKPERAPAEGVFVVTNTLNVTVRELGKLGDVLASSANAGANSIWGIDFRISDPAPLIAQARDKAVADALDKAQRLARASGAKLGPLLSVEESGGGGPMPAAAMYSARMTKAVPVEAGAMEVTADVVLRFALE